MKVSEDIYGNSAVEETNMQRRTTPATSQKASNSTTSKGIVAFFFAALIIAPLAMLPMFFLVFALLRAHFPDNPGTPQENPGTPQETVDSMKKDQMKEISNRVNDLNQKVDSLEKKVNDFHKATDGPIGQLIKDHGETQQKTSNLEKQIEAQERKIRDIEDRCNNAKKELEELRAKINDQMSRLQRQIDIIAKNQPFTAGKALIYFVHSDPLQESRYHPCWSELDERLKRSKFRYSFLCVAQEENRIHLVYDPSRDINFLLNSVATQATTRINWGKVRDLLAEDTEIRLLCIICPNPESLERVITNVGVPIHLIVVRSNLSFDVSRIITPGVLHLIPDSPDKVTDTLFAIMEESAAAQFAHDLAGGSQGSFGEEG